MLSEGANNLYVGVLQIGLYAHGITLNNGIDNAFGAATKQGVKKFQTSKRLTADGIAGRDTFAKLAGVYRFLNMRLTSAPEKKALHMQCLFRENLIFTGRGIFKIFVFRFTHIRYIFVGHFLRFL